MGRDSARIDARRAKFVAAMLDGATVTDAAKAAGVSRGTAVKWQRRPEVAERLSEASHATIETARHLVLAKVVAAVDTLDAVMNDEGSGASARVAAARSILGYALRLHQATVYEERLEEVEQTITTLRPTLRRIQ